MLEQNLGEGMGQHNRGLYTLGTVIVFYWFSLYTYVPILSPYAKTIGASHKMIGLILGSYGLVQLILRIPLGIISDSLTLRKVFINIGAALALVSSIGMWFCSDPFMLLIFRTLAGAAATTWVVYIALFSSFFDVQDSPKATGYINSLNLLGMIAAFIGGGLVSYLLGQRFTFLLAALGGLVGFSLSLNVKESITTHKRNIKLKDLTSLIGDKNLALLSGLAVIIQLIRFATVFGFTPLAAKNIGANEFELNFLTAVSIIPGIISSTASGGLFIKKLSVKTVVTLGFMTASLMCAVIPFVNSMTLLYVTQFIGGFGQGAVLPLLMGTSIKNIDEARRATAMGIFQSIGSIGIIAGPVVVGVLSETAGMKWGFWIIGFLGILGAFASLAVIKNRQVNTVA